MTIIMCTDRLFCLLCCMMLFSCTSIKEVGDIIQQDKDSGEYTSVSMVIPPIEILEDEPLTKMTVDIVSSPIAYLWSATDTVGIFPDAGSQIYFSMADGVGTSEVHFDGGGWALKKESSYYSYFPFVPDFYIDKDALPLTFEGQSQKGNADPSVADVGRYCYMASKGVADETTGSLNFEYKRLAVLHRFKIPVDAGTYESLSVRVDSPVIACHGSFSAVEITQEIKNAQYTDELSMTLEDVTFDAPSTLVVFMMLPPFNILNEQLTINLKKSDGTIVTSSAFGKNYLLGTAYGSSMHMSVYAKDTLIDGNGGSTQVVITASGSVPYTVSTDVDWLTLDTYPVSGSAVITASASKGNSVERVGHVIVSEDVTYKGTTVTLQNVVEITQDMVGMDVGLGDWETGEDEGGTAE